jgi:hypothetical protein
MKTKRYAFALEQLEPGDWARFESFASQFLAFDYAAGDDRSKRSEGTCDEPGFSR